MEKEQRNIGELFGEKLHDLSVGNPEEGWNALDTKLDKVNFFRFHLSGFNVYYAALIATSFLFSSSVFVDYFLLSRDRNKTANAPVQIHPSVNEQIDQHTVPDPEHLPAMTKTPLNNPVFPSEPIVPQVVIAKDSAEGKVKEEPFDESKKIVNPERKVIYVTKQDTVVVYDTLILKNNRYR